MGRGSTGVLEAPPMGLQPSDHVLVAAVRRGDDRAFETLYSRYHRRIQAYVLGMCKDHGRAEDVTQEVFVSALRRMRETERPIAFKPWIYEIAKNACIDLFRRSRRAEEVPLEADDDGAPSELSRLAADGPTPEAAVAAKQALDQLCGAFGGLSDVHHEILVMRELEGLSYREIGERLGMSRPAVESTLFRARRRLTEEYDELVSGQRCVRVLSIIATAAADGARLGARDTRRLARHVSHCQPCRREALAAGLDVAALPQPLRKRVAGKVAGLLPFPVLVRRFSGARSSGDTVAHGGGWLSQLPVISDQLGAGWGKAIAAAAVLLAGVGAGVGTNSAIGGGPDRSAHAAPRSAAAVKASAPAAKAHRRAPRSREEGSRAARDRSRSSGHGAGHTTFAAAPARGGGTSSKPATVTHGSSPVDSVRRTVTSGGTSTTSAPKVEQSVPSLSDVVKSPSDSNPVEQVAAPVKQVVAPVQQVAAPVEEAVTPVTDTVQGTVGTVETTVGDTAAPVVDKAQDTVGGVLPAPTP